MHKVQDYIVLYNKAVRQFLCEGWHFTHMWKGFAWPHHFTKRGCLGPLNLFSPATFYLSVCTKTGKWAVMYLCVMASILPLSMVFLLDCGSVPTALYSYSCLIHFITNVKNFNLTWTWTESPISHPRCGHSNHFTSGFLR
jgi:hypothetical protein